jgi:nucleotide-binding universal stress UspA family protein
MAGLALLYSGTPEEAAAVNVAAGLATALQIGAEYRYMAGVRAIVGTEQWRDYQTVVGLEGFATAHPIFEDQFQTLLGERARDADAALAQLPEARAFVRGQPIELLDTPEAALATLGFTYDLVLASFDADPTIPDLLIRQTLVRGGGPVALIKAPLRSGDWRDSTVIVAWKPLVAASRALRCALPILRTARSVMVVSVEEYGESPMSPDAHAIAAYLQSSHRIAAEAHVLRPADSSVLQLAECYHEIGADLLVMGGYSHSRLQELLFGGFTKYFTEKQFCNLYLAH